MTFLQARKALKKLAAGEYNAIKYELTEFKNGEFSQKCTVYIHQQDHYSGDTWEEALKKMDAAINPARRQAEIKKEIKQSAPRG